MGRGGMGTSILFHHLLQGCQHIVQLLLLPLGANVLAHPLFDELEHVLVFGYLEQIHEELLLGICCAW